MSEYLQLKSLEGLIESFLQNVVSRKQDRLSVLDGVNRLDDIVRLREDGTEVTDQIGNWFAEHNNWLNEKVLSSGELSRVGRMLFEIQSGLTIDDEVSPADEKIINEIKRWTEITGVSQKPRKFVLRRGPEEQAGSSQPDTISKFGEYLDKLSNIYKDLSGNSKHIMSVLDSSLKSALLQKNKEALILSAYIIYYLKQNGYITGPYVKRLKKAEEIISKETKSKGISNA